MTPDGWGETVLGRAAMLACRAMGFYDTYFLPRLVHFACGQKPAMKQRQKIVPLAEGMVLEIGIGSGLNIPFYNPEKVQHLWGIDPSREMWAIAGKNAREHHLDAEFLESGAESIPLDDHSADKSVVGPGQICLGQARHVEIYQAQLPVSRQHSGHR